MVESVYRFKVICPLYMDMADTLNQKDLQKAGSVALPWGSRVIILTKDPDVLQFQVIWKCECMWPLENVKGHSVTLELI